MALLLLLSAVCVCVFVCVCVCVRVCACVCVWCLFSLRVLTHRFALLSASLLFSLPPHHMLVLGRNVPKFFHRVPAEAPGARESFRLKTDEEFFKVRVVEGLSIRS